jgi:hypothetical protein
MKICEYLNNTLEISTLRLAEKELEIDIEEEWYTYELAYIQWIQPPQEAYRKVKLNSSKYKNITIAFDFAHKNFIRLIKAKPPEPNGIITLIFPWR